MNNAIPENVQIGDSILYQTLKDEVVLLNISNQQYYGLDDVGARMWELLLELPDLTAVTHRLTSDYEVDAIVVRADLERLVEQLLNAGLLKGA